MQHEGELVSRATILENAWKVHSDTVTNRVDVYVNYLRKKIDEGSPSKRKCCKQEREGTFLRR